MTDGIRPSRDDAIAADAEDPLAALRDRFVLPEGLVYLDGNSLGPLQPEVAEAVRTTVQDAWGQGLIRSWNDAGWVDLADRVAARLAPLIGATAGEVAVTDSTSVDLFKALAAARRLRPDRHVLLTEATNFPTDRYVAEGLADLLGDIEVRSAPADLLVDHLDPEVAVVTLTHVDYRTGRRHDAPELTAAAHDAGAVVVWDLSHSAGAMRVDLEAWGADLAVGCTYKYLNGGPGSPGYLYVARRWHDQVRSPIAGWFGHAEPFAFAPDYRPAPGARRFLAGTPPVLSLAALEAALAVWEGVDLDLVEAKAAALTERFRDLILARCADHVEVVGPDEPTARGAQVSLRHPQAGAISQALIDRGVIGDHRPPDLVRFGFAPLYISHVDVHDAVDRLAEVLDDELWRDPRYARHRTVT